MSDEDDVFGSSSRKRAASSSSEADVFEKAKSATRSRSPPSEKDSSSDSDDSEDGRKEAESTASGSVARSGSPDASRDAAPVKKDEAMEQDDDDDASVKLTLDDPDMDQEPPKREPSKDRSPAPPKKEPKAEPESEDAKPAKEDEAKENAEIDRLEKELAALTGKTPPRKGWRLGEYLDLKAAAAAKKKAAEAKAAAAEAERRRAERRRQEEKEREAEETRRRERKERKRREEEEALAKERKKKRAVIDSDEDSRDELPSASAQEAKKEPEKPPAKPLPKFSELSERILGQCSEGMKPLFTDLFGDQYDVRLHTSFFCVCCCELVTSTAQWEDHAATGYHGKTLAQWRFCADLKKELNFVTSGQTAKAQAEVDAWKELLVGAEEAVEISTTEGKTRHWVCTLCLVSFSESEQLVGHLGSLSHIDKYLERMKPELVRPPRKGMEVEDNIANIEGTEDEKKVRECGQMTMSGLGRGRLRCYRGERFLSWPEEVGETEAGREREANAAAVQHLFSVPGAVPADFPLPYVREEQTGNSVANLDYGDLPLSAESPVTGLQYLVELWAPTRRAVPLFYCLLCEVTTWGWEEHCSLLKHASLYAARHYNNVLEIMLKEAGEDQAKFKALFNTARQRLLAAEGRMARVGWILQQKAPEGRVFVAFNRDIAAKLAVEARVEVGDPPKKPKGRKTIRPKAPAVPESVQQDFSAFGKVYEKGAARPAAQTTAQAPGKVNFGHGGHYQTYQAADGRAGVDFSSLRSDDDPVVVPTSAVGVPENFKGAGAISAGPNLAAAPASDPSAAAARTASTNFAQLSTEDVGRLNANLQRAGVSEFVSNDFDFENLRKTMPPTTFENFISNCRK